MRKRVKEHPQDPNQAAAWIVKAATSKNPPKIDGKNPAAVALGKLGGLKGGKARAMKLSKEQRKQIAQTAARARWSRRAK